MRHSKKNDDIIFEGGAFEDRRCTRCGKHITELKPYGEGAFAGATLVKTYRNINLLDTTKNVRRYCGR